jgi:hypothetical protein
MEYITPPEFSRRGNANTLGSSFLRQGLHTVLLFGKQQLRGRGGPFGVLQQLLSFLFDGSQLAE